MIDLINKKVNLNLASYVIPCGNRPINIFIYLKIGAHKIKSFSYLEAAFKMKCLIHPCCGIRYYWVSTTWVTEAMESSQLLYLITFVLIFPRLTV